MAIKQHNVDNLHGLNTKQRAFADYYIQTRNATQSYKQAFGVDVGQELSYGTCASNGSKLLKMDKVKNYISDRLKELDNERLLDIEEIVLEITKIALNPAHKPSDRIRALELLGKQKAMFTDRTQNDSTMEVEINLIGELQDELKKHKE